MLDFESRGGFSTKPRAAKHALFRVYENRYDSARADLSRELQICRNPNELVTSRPNMVNLIYAVRSVSSQKSVPGKAESGLGRSVILILLRLHSQVGQDAALSRPRREFEPLWSRHFIWPHSPIARGGALKMLTVWVGIPLRLPNIQNEV